MIKTEKTVSKDSNEMPKRFREARQLKKIKLTDAAKLLGVSQPTLSAWEGERKFPSLGNLERMAGLYNVTTDYLLGRDPGFTVEAAAPIPKQALPILHGKPVWIPQKGWALVNAADGAVLFANGERLQFAEVDRLMPAAEKFSEPAGPCGAMLSRAEILSHGEVWVEPISKDPALAGELRGRYRLKGRFVENDFGNRFPLDSYGAKWLAFEDFAPPQNSGSF
jgi:transcriptional regulator with XRE-family HTH domain